MPKASDTEGKTTGTIRVVPDQWSDFQEWCRQRHTSHSEELRYFIRERMENKVVFLVGLKAEALEEVEAYAEELSIEFEDAVRRIVTDFVAQRRKANPGKPMKPSKR